MNNDKVNSDEIDINKIVDFQKNDPVPTEPQFKVPEKFDKALRACLNTPPVTIKRGKARIKERKAKSIKNRTFSQWVKWIENAEGATWREKIMNECERLKNVTAG